MDKKSEKKCYRCGKISSLPNMLRAWDILLNDSTRLPEAKTVLFCEECFEKKRKAAYNY